MEKCKACGHDEDWHRYSFFGFGKKCICIIRDFDGNQCKCNKFSNKTDKKTNPLKRKTKRNVVLDTKDDRIKDK